MAAETMDKRPPTRLYWLIFAGSTILFFALGVMLALVFERRQEGLLVPTIVVPLADNEPDSEIWGKNFPREFNSFQMTKDVGLRTKYGGAVQFSRLDRDSNIRHLFAGYPFSVEYNQARGHFWSLEDVEKTARIDTARGGKASFGTCFTCKTSNLPGLMASIGPDKFFDTPFEKMKESVKYPIGCANCHDPKTMALRLTNPAIRKSLSDSGKDPDRLPRQEMRSLVCAQCHCEYYFQASDHYLTLPWKYGTSPDNMEKYYDEIAFTDWTHKDSKTPMIKMQHPDYEIFVTGIHAYRGLACADCHMPYVSEGGVKYTNHHVQSPLTDIAHTCAVCHRQSEQEIRARVEIIQDTIWEKEVRSSQIIAQAHAEVAQALASGVDEEALKGVRQLIRKAQLRWDYIAAGNSMGFHSPLNAASILSDSIDLAQEARVQLARLKKAD
ncbi:MAG: ammonia-forming cytochrome c nitrite reductase subunit c552 [Candidatus Brocadiia bacterium]